MIEVFITILTVLLIIDCFLLGLLVMLQRPKQEGLGAAFGGGMMNETFGAQTTDILQKGTKFLGIAFFALAILIAILQARHMNEVRYGNDETPDVFEKIEPASPMNPSLPAGFGDMPLDLSDPVGTEIPLTPPALDDAPAAPAAGETTPEAPTTGSPAAGAPAAAPEAPEAPAAPAEEAPAPAETPAKPAE